MRSALASETHEALARSIPIDEGPRRALAAGLLRFATVERDGARVVVSRRGPVTRLLRALSDEAGEVSPTDPLPRARVERRLELRAAFLASGSLASPQAGYHLEFTLATTPLAARLTRLLRSEGVAPQSRQRAQHTVIYFKSIDAIVTVLSAIGAHAAVLQLENVRATNETKNRIHRLVNTEAANVVRAAKAGAAQREALAFLADAYGLRNLSPVLREAAQLRIAYPDETLTELGRRALPPVGKATINGRIAALLRLVIRLRTA